MSNVDFSFVSDNAWQEELRVLRADAFRSLELFRMIAVAAYLRLALETLLVWLLAERVQDAGTRYLRLYGKPAPDIRRGKWEISRLIRVAEEMTLLEPFRLPGAEEVPPSKRDRDLKDFFNDNLHFREPGSRTWRREHARKALAWFDEQVRSIHASMGGPPRNVRARAHGARDLATSAAGLEEPLKRLLHNRLTRQQPESVETIRPPILFVGDIGKARVATVGLHASVGEYRPGEQLNWLRDKKLARFQDREKAIGAMVDYFSSGEPVYEWYRHLKLIAEGMGLSYEKGQVAHIDLVQEVTPGRWDELKYRETEALLDADIGFVRELLSCCQFDVLLCVDSWVEGTIVDPRNGLVDRELAPRRAGTIHGVQWFVSEVESGEHRFAVAGWNQQLWRRPYASRDGGWPEDRFRELGAKLREELGGYLPATA